MTAFDQRFVRTDLPVSHLAASFGNYVPRTAMQAEALAGLRFWAESAVASAESRLIIGSAGSGKTHLLASAVRRRLLLGSQTIGFVDIPSIRTARSPDGWTAHVNFLRYLAYDLLVLDDFGEDAATTGIYEFATSLVEDRFHRHVPTLAASRFPIAELVRRGYAPMLRHLTWHEVPFHLDSPDEPDEVRSQRIPGLDDLEPLSVDPICPLV